MAITSVSLVVCPRHPPQLRRWVHGARLALVSTVRRAVRGRVDDAVWERPALLALLVAAAVLYTWNLGTSGWGDAVYSAAVQAGTQNWTALFYGSADAANSITTGVPPLSLWAMALSAGVFGLSPWSVLLPEAIMGVATVAVVYATVRRSFSAGTALLAAAVLATTPVAALMFRLNAPDALLALLMSLTAYCALRAVETGAVRWTVCTGVTVGLGFLTSPLLSLVVVPVIVAVFLYASPLGARARAGQLGIFVVVATASAGWWIAIVELVPQGWRPYVGGSATDSFLEATFGGSGLAGLIVDAVTGTRVGLSEIVSSGVGTQIAWLAPAALVLGALGLVLLRVRPRSDPQRATVLLSLGAVLLGAVALCLGTAELDASDTVVFAPALAILVATGATLLWQKRSVFWARGIAAVVTVGTAVWASLLMAEATGQIPVVAYISCGLALLAAVLLLFPKPKPKPQARSTVHSTNAAPSLKMSNTLAATTITATTITVTTITVALSAVLLAPALYSLQTAAGVNTLASAAFASAASASAASSTATSSADALSSTVTPTGGSSSAASTSIGSLSDVTLSEGLASSAADGQAGSAALVDGVPNGKVVALLENTAHHDGWAAATVGSTTAAPYQLASGRAVMPVGGADGTDPAPTLEQFIEYVATGRIDYFIDSGSVEQLDQTSDVATTISSWVAENYTAQAIDGVIVYSFAR